MGVSSGRVSSKVESGSAQKHRAGRSVEEVSKAWVGWYSPCRPSFLIMLFISSWESSWNSACSSRGLGRQSASERPSGTLRSMVARVRLKYADSLPCSSLARMDLLTSSASKSA